MLELPQLLERHKYDVCKIVMLVFILQGLFMTDNSSVDAAASWVLDNQHLPDIDEPFKVWRLQAVSLSEGIVISSHMYKVLYSRVPEELLPSICTKL